MRRTLWLLALTAALLTSCAHVGTPADAGGKTISAVEPMQEAHRDKLESDRSTLRALIVDGAETGELVLASEGEAPGVYLLNTSGVPVTLAGAESTSAALEDGMTVEIGYDGELPLTIPAELSGSVSIAAWPRGTVQNPGGAAYDLCGLYLQVLDDLWNRDSGLNGGAKYVSVDLSAAPGELSDTAKFAVAWVFAQSHGVQALTLSYAELAEQGYLTAIPEAQNLWQWDDGVLLRIRAEDWAEGEVYSLPVVKFDAEKWRSPLGAYLLCDCSAVWSEMGTWGESYHIGAEAIA